MERASALGDYAALCEHYAKRFRRWSDAAIPFEQKSRELKAFEGLRLPIAAELGP
jgi:hypothetical protein